MLSRRLCQKIGWQGVTLDVFDEWSVVGFGGDEKSGSVRIDGGADLEDTAITGVELRWSQAKNKQTREMLEARIKPLLKAVEKEGKVRGGGEVVVKLRSDVEHSEREFALDFRWQTDRAGHGRIFHCGQCNRILVAQAYGRPSVEFNRLSNMVLDSVQCHSRTASTVTWGLYGLLVEVPAEYELVHQQLMNIYLQLKFQRKGGADQLMIEQWSLANIQLKGAYLDEWYDVKSIGWTDGVSSQKAESTVNGHPSLSVSGRKDMFPAVQIDSARQWAKFKAPALEYEAVLWECPDSNKAFMVQGFTRKKMSSPVRECATGLVCHDSIGSPMGESSS